MLREQLTDEDHLAVKCLALIFVISRMRSQDLTQYIGFEYGGINPSIRKLRFQCVHQSRFS